MKLLSLNSKLLTVLCRQKDLEKAKQARHRMSMLPSLPAWALGRPRCSRRSWSCWSSCGARRGRTHCKLLYDAPNQEAARQRQPGSYMWLCLAWETPESDALPRPVPLALPAPEQPLELPDPGATQAAEELAASGRLAESSICMAVVLMSLYFGCPQVSFALGCGAVLLGLGRWKESRVAPSLSLRSRLPAVLPIVLSFFGILRLVIPAAGHVKKRPC